MQPPPFLATLRLVDQVVQMICNDLPGEMPQLAPRPMPRLIPVSPTLALTAAQILRMPRWHVAEKLAG